MIKTVEIESRFSWFNIGTYGSWFELDYDGQDSSMEIEWQIEEGRIPEDWTDLSWEEQEKIGEIQYDHDGWLNAIASESIEYVKELVKYADDSFKGIITSLEWDGATSSPCEYNFDTDKYWLEVKFDSDLMERYIANNREAYDQYVKDYWTSYDGFISGIGADDDETKAYFVLNQIGLADNDEPHYAHAMHVLDVAKGNGQYFWFEFTPEWQAKLDHDELVKADKANELQLFDTGEVKHATDNK